MRRLTITAFGLLGLVLLGGCAWLDKAKPFVVEAAGRAVVGECFLSEGQRERNLVAVNGWLEARGHRPRVLALDCDGDGAPDFQESEDG